METFVQEDNSINIVSEEIANMNSNLFRLCRMCLGYEDLKILQQENKKRIMGHDGGEALKIQYRHLTD